MFTLITDFDGVICDSAVESFLCAYNAHLKIEQPDAPRLLDGDRLSHLLHHDFRRLRSYLHGAEDFLPLVKAALTREPINCQTDFDRYREQFEEHLTFFQHTFYEERDYLREREPELWLSLNPLFEEAAGPFRQLAPFENVYILTTKRREDVEDILSYWGIDFPSDHIYPVSAREKYPRLRELMALSGSTPAEITYIEDQISFLPPAASHGIKVYRAGWGYVSPEQKETARSHSIPVIEKKEMARLMDSLRSKK